MGSTRRLSVSLGMLGLVPLIAACGHTATPTPPPKAPSSAVSASSSAPVASSAPPAPASPTVVATFHGDGLRTGWAADETVLTPQTVVAGLALHWTSAALGGDVRGQPLYVGHVMVGGAAHDVVYVATEADTVWALDAHTGAVLWGPVRIGTPVPRADLPCGNVDPEGITATPVIDPQAGAIYVVGEAQAGGQIGFVAAGLDLATGRVLAGWPVAIAPAGFDARTQQERSALTLVTTPDGAKALEVSFGGLWGDCGTYHGWVVQVPVAHPGAQAAWRTPTASGGAIWSPGGLADTAQGLFAVTGNSFPASPGDMGNSIVRLLPGAGSLTQPAGAAGYFTPSNALAMDRSDRDLGSGGPLALPDQPGPYPHLLFVAGKEGTGYLVNRDAPGGQGQGDGITGEGLWSGCLYGGCRSTLAEAVFTTAAYFRTGAGASYIVTAGQLAQPAPCSGTGGVVAWRLTTRPSPSLRVAWCGPSMGDPGSPTVSSHGGSGAIAWVVDTQTPRLMALDGTTGKVLWQGSLPPLPRFAVPTVADGQVLVAAGASLLAYGVK